MEEQGTYICTWNEGRVLCGRGPRESEGGEVMVEEGEGRGGWTYPY